MSKAEERALEAYPIVMSQYSDNCKEYDSNESDRLTFIEGYHQAEKDMKLGWEDMFNIFRLVNEAFDDYAEGKTKKEIGEEVLRRFRVQKGE